MLYIFFRFYVPVVTIGNFYIFKPMRYDIFHNNAKRYIATIYTPTHIWSLNADSLSAYDAYPSKPRYLPSYRG